MKSNPTLTSDMHEEYFYVDYEDRKEGVNGNIDDDDRWIWIVYDDFRLTANFSLTVGKPLMRQSDRNDWDPFQSAQSMPIR